MQKLKVRKTSGNPPFKSFLTKVYRIPQKPAKAAKNPFLRLIKLHWLVMRESEVDVVLAFSAALRYLFIIMLLLCFWESFNH